MPISADQIPERVAKQWARRLKDTLTDLNLAPGITLSQAQQCIARQLGYGDWHAYQAACPSPVPVKVTTPVLISDDGVSLFTRDTLIDRIVRDRGLNPEQAYRVMADLYHCGLISYPRTFSASLPSYRYQYVVHDLRDIALALPELHAAAEEGHWENAPPGLWDDAPEHHAIIPCRAAALLNALDTLTDDERWVWETVARRFVACFAPKHPHDVVYAHPFMEHLDPLLLAWLNREPDEEGQQAWARWASQVRQGLRRVPHAKAYRLRFRLDATGHVTQASAVNRSGQRWEFSCRGMTSRSPTLAAWFQHWHETPPEVPGLTLTWGPFDDERRPLRKNDEEVEWLFRV